MPLADVYCSLDLLDEALDILREGLRWHPNYGVGRALLAHVYNQMGRASEASFEAQRVLQNDPKNILAQRIFSKRSESAPEASSSQRSRIQDFQIRSLTSSSAPSSSKKVAVLEQLLKKIQARAQLS